MGLGDAGTPLSNPLVPTAPTNSDSGLENDILISATDSTCADYRLTPNVGYYKCPFDTIEFEQDTNNDNSYLVMKISTTIQAGYANGFNLSEAGLFTAKDRNGPWHIYARVTFPSLVKTSSNIFLIIWYIYV